MRDYPNNFEGLWALASHKLSAFSLENQRVALGVSGGADSIGLFHVFLTFIKQKRISELVIFHINFGLRGEESDGDEAFVRSICERENISFHAQRALLEFNSGIQDQARQVRCEQQNQFIDKGYIIALAHNADDVAENILLRLSRGSSLENAAGMTYFDGYIFRPWLDAPRQTIRKALEGAGIAWREDSSNSKNIYTRNKIRNEAMPVLESLYPGAASRSARSFLDAHIIPKQLPQVKDICIPMADLATLAKNALGKVIHDFLTHHYGGQSAVSRRVIEQIASAIHRVSTGLDGESREFQLPDNKFLLVSKREIRLNERK